MMMIIWWSKHVGVILNVLVCDIWINVLLQTNALVGPLYIMNWNAQWNSEILFKLFILCILAQFLQLHPTNGQNCHLVHIRIFKIIELIHASDFTGPSTESTLNFIV
jgi:hypothetical protein